MKNTKLFNKGFTLIELLVVVAIIGILASVVLASLNNARNKGADAAIKANLANMRAQAALYYDDNNTYNNTGSAISCDVAVTGETTPEECLGLFSNEQMLAAMQSAAKASNVTVVSNTDSIGEKWAASAALKQAADGNFCVDGDGSAKINSHAEGGICVDD